jgi:hypothetical protein
MSGKYKYTITIPDLSASQLKADIFNLVNLCDHLNIPHISVLFGFAWAESAYNWIPQDMKSSNLLTEIMKLEDSKFGQLGQDDIFIDFPTFPDTQLNYCHHSEIHLMYNEENQLITKYKQIWNQEGYKILES